MARSIAIDDRNMHPVSLGCPFGDVGEAAEPPLPLGEELGVLWATGGKGDSATSESVSIGFGASAGGKYSVVTSCKRLAG